MSKKKIPSRHSSFKVITSADADALPLSPIEIPTFPHEVMFGGAMEHYYEAYYDRNEICPSYQFASAIIQVGAIMGRSVWIVGMPKPLYPNVYAMLLGKTAAPRKSTARQFAVEHAKSVKLIDENPPLQVISSVATTEGLVHQLRTKEMRQAQRTVEGEDGAKDTEQYLKEIVVYPDLPEFEGVRMLIHIDEMMSMFTKRQQQSSSGIIATLTELYSMPLDIQNTSKTASELAEYPCVSILGCSTQEWFGQGIRTSDIIGGWANRWQYYSGEKMPPKSYAEELDGRHLARWNEHLVSLRQQFEGTHQRFTMTDEVRERKHNAYIEEHDRLWDSDNELANAASARQQDHVHKLALIFTLMDTPVGNTVVGEEQWEKAETVGQYLLESNLQLFGAIATDAIAENENKILAVLEKKGNEANKRDIRRAINSNMMSADAFNKALDALEKAGHVELIPSGRKTIVTRIFR